MNPPRRPRCALAGLLTAALAGVAQAHGGEAHGHEPAGPRGWAELWGAWAFEPLVVVPLLLSAGVYARGVARLWTDAGPGRGVRGWEAAYSRAGGWPWCRRCIRGGRCCSPRTWFSTRC